MRLVTRGEFLTMPAGTVYYDADQWGNDEGPIEIKGESFVFDGLPKDYYVGRLLPPPERFYEEGKDAIEHWEQRSARWDGDDFSKIPEDYFMVLDDNDAQTVADAIINTVDEQHMINYHIRGLLNAGLSADEIVQQCIMAKLRKE
ncbi:hypothetical protein ACAX43_12500 [Paraburkholderia sp. IW21]|uniref:hypothetical protein n=1 Tax=Paraburkholderia sp. IW21 TaxID=3242488 RepID=UPI00352306AB